MIKMKIQGIVPKLGLYIAQYYARKIGICKTLEEFQELTKKYEAICIDDKN